MLYIHLRQNVSYIFRTFYRFNNFFFAHFYISTIILVKSHNAVQINQNKKDHKKIMLIRMIVCVSNR